MFKTLLGGKIHRATVTQADLNYVGSITIDQNLLDAAGICVNEKVQIVNNNNGARFETYTIAGERGSGIVCLNGRAAGASGRYCHHHVVCAAVRTRNRRASAQSGAGGWRKPNPRDYSLRASQYGFIALRQPEKQSRLALHQTAFYWID